MFSPWRRSSSLTSPMDRPVLDLDSHFVSWTHSTGSCNFTSTMRRFLMWNTLSFPLSLTSSRQQAICSIPKRIVSRTFNLTHRSNTTFPFSEQGTDLGLLLLVQHHSSLIYFRFLFYLSPPPYLGEKSTFFFLQFGNTSFSLLYLRSRSSTSFYEQTPAPW